MGADFRVRVARPEHMDGVSPFPPAHNIPHPPFLAITSDNRSYAQYKSNGREVVHGRVG